MSQTQSARETLKTKRQRQKENSESQSKRMQQLNEKKCQENTEPSRGPSVEIEMTDEMKQMHNLGDFIKLAKITVQMLFFNRQSIIEGSNIHLATTFVCKLGTIWTLFKATINRFHSNLNVSQRILVVNVHAVIVYEFLFSHFLLQNFTMSC